MTQTCFQGRHGEELGSDQYGAHILMHAPDASQKDVHARLQNVEVTNAGQAFRLGRYAIHFHLNGDQTGSYVKNCSVHKSYNRAVNIHDTHNVLVEHNVVYDIMGGALFMQVLYLILSHLFQCVYFSVMIAEIKGSIATHFHSIYKSFF